MAIRQKLRQYNDQVAAAQTRFGTRLDAPVAMLCECDDADCETMIEVTVIEHAARVGTGETFVALGHPCPSDPSRTVDGRYVVCEAPEDEELPLLESELPADVVRRASEPG